MSLGEPLLYFSLLALIAQGHDFWEVCWHLLDPRWLPYGPGDCDVETSRGKSLDRVRLTDDSLLCGLCRRKIPVSAWPNPTIQGYLKLTMVCNLYQNWFYEFGMMTNSAQREYCAELIGYESLSWFIQGAIWAGTTRQRGKTWCLWSWTFPYSQVFVLRNCGFPILSFSGSLHYEVRMTSLEIRAACRSRLWGMLVCSCILRKSPSDGTWAEGYEKIYSEQLLLVV